MGRRARNKVAEIREQMEGVYGSYDQDKLKEEVLRLLKQKQSEIDDRKARAKASSDLIKELEGKIDYLVGRIDSIKHEEAVARELAK